MQRWLRVGHYSSVVEGRWRDQLTLIGKKPRYQIPDDLPKPTKALEMRTDELDINKNVNKTMIVQTSTSGTGPRGAGFYVSKARWACMMCVGANQGSVTYAIGH